MNLNHLYFKIHPKIRTYLIKPILGKNTDYYAVLPTMKEFSMDFMEYMSKPNSLKSFGDYLKLFDRRDWPLLLRFLSSKVFSCSVDLMKKENLYLEKEYRKYLNIFYRKGYYELSIKNKTYKDRKSVV